MRRAELALAGLCLWILLFGTTVYAFLGFARTPRPAPAPWHLCGNASTLRCVRDERCLADPLSQPDCCLAHMVSLVRAVTRAAHVSGLGPPMALAGTLLGAIREDGRILPWTADVDLGVARADMPRVVAALQADTSVHVFRDGGVWRVCAVPTAAAAATVPTPAFVLTNMVPYIDLYDVFNMTTGLLRRRGVHMPPIPCSTPLREDVVYPLRADPICLYNDTRACLAVVAQPERYLTRLYGPGWREPPPREKQNLHGKGSHVCQAVY